MSKPLFTEVWTRIVAHAGEQFETKTLQPFTYVVDGDGFFPSRTRKSVRNGG